jgi:hypothetical protein
MMGASQSALSIQNPSQTGPHTQVDGDFGSSHCGAVSIGMAAADEERIPMERLQFSLANNAFPRLVHIGRRSHLQFRRNNRVD